MTAAQVRYGETDTDGKLNVVFILTDDQGPWAMGCAGNGEIVTPNLDRLAATGMRMDHFFCTSPVCSPARATLFTGKIPSQHGVHDWIREGNAGPDTVPYLRGQLTYTELLAAAGYTCGLSGKWHLGDSMQPQHGFTHWYAHESGGGPYYNAPMIRDGERIVEPGYVTDAITEDAIRFIERRSEDGEPFYLSVHYTAPHSPWIGNHPQPYIDMYADCLFESCPQPPKHPWSIYGGAKDDPARTREQLKGYFAAVTAMDARVGDILDTLEKLGLRERTLVVFMSDNGFNCGHHGIWGKGNGTFPQNMYDTSVKVPAIFSCPGAIPQGAVCSELLSGYDWMPTLLDLLDIAHPDAERLPGRSFKRQLLSGQPDRSGRQEEPCIHDSVVVCDEYGPVRMLRTRTWKYVHRYPYGPHELYDLVADPEETINLIADAACAGRAAVMRAQLESWFHRYVDPAADGVREPVTGSGQTGLSGLAGQGRNAFSDEYVRRMRGER